MIASTRTTAISISSAKAATPVRPRMSDPVQFLAFGFGSGLAPKAPGTVGSIAAIPVYLLFAGQAPAVYAGIVLVAAVLGVWICGAASERLALWAVPVTPLGVVLAFLAFRVFDIAKPWPIGWLDKHTQGGFGIMIDDVVAGCLACAVVHLILTLGAA